MIATETDYVKELREFMEPRDHYNDEPAYDYATMSQEQAKKAIIDELEFIYSVNGSRLSEMYQSELELAKLVGLDLEMHNA